ncbi:MAG: xylose isomerase [Thalassobius sp.]|nr:xylose isomerase [Thalassovita sp.]
MKQTRKEFMKMIGVGVLASASAPLAFGKSNKKNSNEVKHKLNLGLASYTLRSLSLDETLKVAKRLQLNSIAFKSMHLPLESSPETLKEVAMKVKNAGLDLYGAGVIYMKTEDEVNKAFEYAKTAGMRVIIGVPNYELLSLVEKKVKETDIKLAIHNHGPGDDVYPSPESVYEKIKNLDSRIGMCIDIGHTFRIGEDPSEKARKFADRLHDIHMKDVDGLGAKGKPLEIGRGIMDIPDFLRTLQEIKYDGIVAFEYEKDGDDPIPGLAESVGYVRGALAAMTVQ